MFKQLRYYGKKSSTISLSWVQKHHALLDEQGNKLYSEQAIQQVLDKLSIEPARNRPTAENWAAKQALLALQEPDSPKQLLMTAQLEHSEDISDCIHQVRVEHEYAFMNLNISSTLDLDQFEMKLKRKFEF